MLNFIMGSLALSIVRRCFNLSFELADRVVRWIGHSGELGGTGGQGIEEEVRQQFTGLADKFKPKKDKSK
jgi:hypothetical protein